MTADPKHHDVIRRPLITEKGTMVSEHGAVLFEVALSANKAQIKQAVEAVFDVKVDGVNTVIAKGKTKRFRGTKGKRKSIKKAYVALAEGHTIDVFTGL